MAALIECDGTRLGTLRLPSFRIAAHDFVCLHLPDDGSPATEQLHVAFTGAKLLPGLHLSGTLTWANPPMPRRNFLGMVRDPAIASWLTKAAGLSGGQARTLLQMYDIAPATRIGRMSWTVRHLIALEAALLRSADVIGFATAGLDPGGIAQMFELVKAHRDRHAFLHLAFRPVGEGLCLAGGQCLVVTKQPRGELTPAAS